MQTKSLLEATAIAKARSYTIDLPLSKRVRMKEAYEPLIQVSHKCISILIPANINIKYWLYKHPPKLRMCVHDINQQADKIATILSLLVKAYLSKMRKSGSHIDEYVPFNAQILQNHVRDYDVYLDYLLEIGIIESDNFYIQNEKSTGYRFSEKYRFAPLTDYIISDKRGNVKKGGAIFNSFFKLADDQKISIIKYKALYEDLCKVTLSSYDDAKYYILNDLKEQVCKILKDENKIDVKVNSWISTTHDLHNGHLYFSQDKTSFRLHTSVIGIKTECRRFLRLNKKPIISCDLKNSQPYLSAFLFTKGNINDALNKVLMNCLQDIKSKDVNIYKSIINRIHNFKTGEISTSTKHYINLVKNGELYEFLAIKLSEIKNISAKKQFDYSRDVGKQEVFKLFFNPTKYNSISRDIFRLHFPEVMSLFEDINVLFTHTRKESEMRNIPRSSNTLAKILQSIESHLILDVICVSMKEKYPHIPLLTLHDAIATNPVFFNILKKEMKNILYHNIGITPTFKPEIWK